MITAPCPDCEDGLRWVSRFPYITGCSPDGDEIGCETCNGTGEREVCCEVCGEFGAEIVRDGLAVHVDCQQGTN